MSRKKLFAILAAESVAIIALYVLTARMQETFSAIYNFPFEQIGLGLRALHGLGGFGVGAAFALWIGFSLLPMIPAVCGRRKSAWEKALLFAVDDAVCYDRSAVHRAAVYGFGLYCENELQHDDMVGAYFIFHSFRGPADARRRQG